MNNINNIDVLYFFYAEEKCFPGHLGYMALSRFVR